MFEVEKDDQEAGPVAEVVQEGYTIGDRLLRPALVGVVKKKVKSYQYDSIIIIKNLILLFF